MLADEEVVIAVSLYWSFDSKFVASPSFKDDLEVTVRRIFLSYDYLYVLDIRVTIMSAFISAS